jgi:hypothetical protein
MLSKFESSPGVKIAKSSGLNGFSIGVIPQHRFVEYEKAKYCIDILE